VIATRAWYVFGVVDASAEPRGADVQLVRHGALAAVTTEVPLEDFGADVLPERLNDRDWLERHARAHEDVLREIAATTTVVPFRFGTVYNDVAGVRALLGDRADELRAALERVRGCVEIGVKLWADRTRFQAALTAPDKPASGRAYLERKRTEQDSARRAADELRTIAADAHERLLAQAVEGVSNRPQPRELTGRAETMLLNGAYLVEDGGQALAAAAAQLGSELEARGVTVELTGPWPPHNFVDLETPE
jgi:hypothetical protein